MAKTLRDIREQQEIADLMEKLTAADPTGKWISDFVDSDNPRFAGKSKKERIRMALGAAYAAKGQNEEASPMIKPPTNRFDNKRDAFDHAKKHGGKVYRREYINPTTGIKDTHFVVKEDAEPEATVNVVEDWAKDLANKNKQKAKNAALLKKVAANVKKREAEQRKKYKQSSMKEEAEALDEVTQGKSYTQAQLQKKIQSGNWEATQDIKPGKHVELRHHTGKRVMVQVKEDTEMDEGLQQKLRKLVPGYAKRQINQKMDAAKFGKTDADKDANYHRYKKVLDKTNEEAELDESASRFIQKVNQAANAAASGKHKNAQMHLDNARTFMLGVKSTEMSKIDDAHKTYKKLRQKYAGTGGNFEPKDQMVGTAKVITKEETDGMPSVKDTYKKIAVQHMKDSMSKDATNKQRQYAKTMHQRALQAMKMSNHTDALNHYRGMSEDFEQMDEAWTQGNRNPQRGIKVGSKVRSYDFPGMHDDHYIEGHVVGEGPHSYQIKVNRVVRSGKEMPVPAHMAHVEAPKGRGMFSQAYAVHKIMDRQNQVSAAPAEPQGAAKTFTAIRGRR